MSWIRGRPLALLVLFFALAVFLTGSLYSVGMRALSGANWIEYALVALLIASLVLSIAILMRILWVGARAGTSANHSH